MFDPPSNIFKQRRRDAALEEMKSVYPRHYCGDNMFVAARTMHFLDDARFSDCMDRLARGEPYAGMGWRMHVLAWALQTALRRDGAILEFGTFRGFKFRFLMDYLGAALADRPVFLFDTFEGIDPDQADGSPITPDEHRKAHLHAFVTHRFSDCENVTIVRGSAPASLAQVEIGRVAFLHLDMNSWKAEIGVLERLWDRIAPGGVIVLDDFGLHSHRAQAERELPWLAERGCPPLELPTGQAIAIRP